MFRAFFIVGLGSFFGGGLRYLLQQLILKITSITFPFGTLAVNILGSFVIGYLSGLALKSGILTDNLKLLLIVGFCGGFTTFSSFSLDIFVLMRNNLYLLAFTYIIISILLGLGATFLAFKLA